MSMGIIVIPNSDGGRCNELPSYCMDVGMIIILVGRVINFPPIAWTSHPSHGHAHGDCRAIYVRHGYPIINGTHVIVLPTCYYNSSRPPIPIQAL